MMSAALVAVLGAGPAGARAAELLAEAGSSVVLLDPKAPWEKPCGGGVTPAAFDDMPELCELLGSAREVGRVRVEVSSEEGFTVELRRPMRIISRRALGRWLLDRAVAAGAVHVPRRVTALRRSGGGWSLETDEGRLRARFVVGADGAASLVRRIVAPSFGLELAPTRVAYPTGPGPTPDTAVIRVFPEVAGYLWDFPRPDHRSVGIMVSPGSLRRGALDQAIDAYGGSEIGGGGVGPKRAGAVIGTAQLGHGAYGHLVGADFALLGDAAGLADPFTGEGIHNALRSAQLFARAWGEEDPGRYGDLVRRTMAREFAFSRFLRRVLLENGTGIGLVRRGLHSDVAYAAVSALLNAMNEHDFGGFSLPGRWLWALRRAWADPESVARGRWRSPAAPEDGRFRSDGQRGDPHRASTAA